MLAFTHIEKCGGTTVIEVLRRELLFDHCDVIPRDNGAMVYDAADLEDLVSWRPSIRSISGHSVRSFNGLESVVPAIKYYVTLRDPIRRYVSDYMHFHDRLGYSGSFEDWLSREDRHNFQTKSLGGTDCLPRAKEALEERYALVGVVEQMPEFLQLLRWLVWQELRVDLGEHYRVANVRWTASPEQAAGERPTAELVERYYDRIKDVNRNDVRLYEHVVRTILPHQRSRMLVGINQVTAKAHGINRQVAPWVSGMRHRSRLAVYRLYRNVIYKPHVGHSPFRTHALPVYREASAA